MILMWLAWILFHIMTRRQLYHKALFWVLPLAWKTLVKCHYERKPRKFQKPGGVIPFSEGFQIGQIKAFPLIEGFVFGKGMILWQPKGKSQVDRLMSGRSCHVISFHVMSWHGMSCHGIASQSHIDKLKKRKKEGKKENNWRGVTI